MECSWSDDTHSDLNHWEFSPLAEAQKQAQFNFLKAWRTNIPACHSLFEPTSQRRTSSSSSYCFFFLAVQTHLPPHSSTQATKEAAGDSLKWHMSPKPLTWQRGSESLWQCPGQRLHRGAAQRALKVEHRWSTDISFLYFLSLFCCLKEVRNKLYTYRACMKLTATHYNSIKIKISTPSV